MIRLEKCFKITKNGNANYILGMEIIRDRKNRKIYLTQRQYIKDILKKFNMNNEKSISIPSDPSVHLNSNS